MTSFLTHAPALIAALVGLSGCTQPAAPAAPASTVANSILVTSTPSAGSVVSGPVNSLMLHFSTPATLHEVIVSGPEGAMPTMISPVGAVEHYSIPLPGLGAGAYTVDWRATADGRQHRGSFGFTVN